MKKKSTIISLIVLIFFVFALIFLLFNKSKFFNENQIGLRNVFYFLLYILIGFILFSLVKFITCLFPNNKYLEDKKRLKITTIHTIIFLATTLLFYFVGYLIAFFAPYNPDTIIQSDTYYIYINLSSNIASLSFVFAPLFISSLFMNIIYLIKYLVNKKNAKSNLLD